MKSLSIRTKITLWFSAALVLVVALTYFVVLFASRQVIQKTVRDSLIETVANNVDEIEYYEMIGEEELADDVDYYVEYGDGYLEVDDDFLDEVNQVYTSLCKEDGTLVYGENPIARELENTGFLDSQIQTLTVNGTLYYVYDYKLTQEGLEGLWLRGIVSEQQGEIQLNSISRTSLILLPSLVLIAIIGGFLIARRTLRPIQQITDAASQIRQGNDLKKRIDLGRGNDELHQLADQFNEMFERLDDSFQAQQQFVSDASHELRTPVSVIMAQCELTLEQMSLSEARLSEQGGNTEKTDLKPRTDDEEYEEALRVIQRQGRKLNCLIGDMLDITRMELQAERYQMEELNFTELVESVCFDMALIQDKGITLSCRAQKDLHFRGNHDLLSRLLMNLIGNAYRYGRENGWIRVELKSREDQILLSVEDNGIGIAAEEQKNIFRRFYQVDTSRTGAGSGLGLAMANEIAQFHHGEIQVESEPGRGSKFTVILPQHA